MVIDADLAMGVYHITLGAGRTVDGIDVGNVGLKVAVSDAVLLNDPTARYRDTASYLEMTSIKVYISGTYRVNFDMKVTGGTGYAQIWLHRPGEATVAYGTEQSTASTSYVAKSEDLEFLAGDTIELQLKAPAGEWVYEDEFILRGDVSITKFEVI